MRPARAVLAGLAVALLAGPPALATIPFDQASPPPARHVSPGPLPGDRPQLLPKTTAPLVGVPQPVTPPLGPGPYVFPVYGASSLVGSFGAANGLGYVHGDDVLGQLGQPVLAAAAGRVFSVGWSGADGNRLALRDRSGNVFRYAHLAAFSSAVRNGARVRAGEVIGFMGATGSAAGGQTRLRFEVHPVSLLFLGADGAVDPTGYLASWRRLQSLPFPVAAGWAPAPSGKVTAPEPGAVLIGVADIASAGLRAGKR